MNSKSLEYMIALSKTGSMTHAAKELYVSQSNLSQFLKNEEAELGTKLFTREQGNMYRQRLEKFTSSMPHRYRR